MEFFKNKHVVTALIVAPILAVVAYFATDSLVKEQPQKAQQNASYPMVVKSNCRFSSGECDLENLAFSAKLTVGESGNTLQLTSTHPLQKATVGFVDDAGAETPATDMTAGDESNKSWALEMPIKPSDKTLARVAVRTNGILYFAETTMQFATYETSFKKDFRTNQ